MERYQAANYRDQLLALCQMKYVQAKVLTIMDQKICGIVLLYHEGGRYAIL